MYYTLLKLYVGCNFGSRKFLLFHSKIWFHEVMKSSFINEVECKIVLAVCSGSDNLLVLISVDSVPLRIVRLHPKLSKEMN